MFKKLLGKTLEEIPSKDRLNILFPIMGLFATVAVIGILWNKLGDSNTQGNISKDDQIKYWKHQSEIKDSILEVKTYKIDSMIIKAYNDKVETNRELQIIINKQNDQKVILRNK